MAEALLVIGHALLQVGIILSRLLEDSVATDDSTLHLLQPQLAPELHCLPGLLPLDDLGVWLKQADNLLRRAQLLVGENAPLGLIDHLLHQGEDLPQLPEEA